MAAVIGFLSKAARLELRGAALTSAPRRFVSTTNMPEHTSNELAGSDEQERLLGPSHPVDESVDHLPTPVSNGVDKPEQRWGDKGAYYGALVCAISCATVITRLTVCYLIDFHPGKLLPIMQRPLTPERMLLGLYLLHLVHRVRQRPCIIGMVPCAPVVPELRHWLLHFWWVTYLSIAHTAYARLSTFFLSRDPDSPANRKCQN